MHADLEQKESECLMRRCRSGALCALISTDFLARNMDLQHVSVVINFDIPSNVDNYLHRIGKRGRCRGRAGRRVAINFIANCDVHTMKDIERFYHTQIEEMPMDIADLL